MQEKQEAVRRRRIKKALRGVWAFLPKATRRYQRTGQNGGTGGFTVKIRMTKTMDQGI